MAKPEGMKCPFIKMKPCVKDECAMYIRMNGKDPNSGEEVNQGGCAMAWNPTIQLEGNKLMNEIGAATESLRNRIDESNKDQKVVITFLKSFLERFTRPTEKQIN